MLSLLLRKTGDRDVAGGLGLVDPGRLDLGERQVLLETTEIVEAVGPAAGLRRDALFRRALAAADCAGLALALLTVVAAFPSMRLRPSALATLPPLVLCAKLFGLYDRDETLLRRTTLEEMPKLFQMATLSSLLIWLAHDLVIAGPFGGTQALVLWSALTVTLPIARVAARTISLRFAPVERCFVIGDALTARALGKRLATGTGVKAEIVGHVDLDDEDPASKDVVGRGLLRIIQLVRELAVHRVIVAPRSADAEDMIDIVRTLRITGTRVSFVPRVLEILGTAVEFDDVHGITLMGMKRVRLSRSSARLKRGFDLLVGSALLLVFAPLMAAIAAAIKLESRGRVLFRQVRVGRRGAPFDMLKFRTMVSNAEALKPGLLGVNEAEPGLFKIANDPRVTRIGRVLRRASLDELPQLINVLRGEMSLVGPRPLVPDEDRQILGWSRRRLDLTPGMTGHWQILRSSRVPLPQMVAIDCMYVTTWSLWTDVKILLRTVPHVLGLRGM